MEPDDLDAHTERMRREALSAHERRMAFTEFAPGEHRDALLRAITNVLSTEVALFTFAQLVDGLPTADVCYDRRYHNIFGDHIIDEVHEELCEGAMDKAREMARDWDPSILKFSPKVLFACLCLFFPLFFVSSDEFRVLFALLLTLGATPGL